MMLIYSKGYYLFFEVLKVRYLNNCGCKPTANNAPQPSAPKWAGLTFLIFIQFVAYIIIVLKSFQLSFISEYENG